jgi:hypothetical protein
MYYIGPFLFTGAGWACGIPSVFIFEQTQESCDMTTPLSNMLQPPSHTTLTQVQPTSSPTQVFDGPITRS